MRRSYLLFFVLIAFMTTTGCLEKKSETESKPVVSPKQAAKSEAKQKKQDEAEKRQVLAIEEVYQTGEYLIVNSRQPSSDVQHSFVVAEPGSAAYEAFDDEQQEYNRIEASGFRTALDAPLSTFSIDVDTAAYTNIRSYLNDQVLPPQDAVRIEEMLNYFYYDFPKPSNQPFAIHQELQACPWNPQNDLLLIALQGRELAPAKLPPSNLVFLIDVSGSMAGADKLGLLKKGFAKLIDQLRPQDRVSLVTYAGANRIVIEGASGSDKARLHRALAELNSGGGTAGAQGLLTAYEIAHRNMIIDGNNRIVLATDGDFNIGISSQADLLRMIEEQRGAGIFLSVLGFGSSTYMEGKMEQLANHGDGNFNFIDSEAEAAKVLVQDMAGTLYALAKDVKIQVEFNPTKVAEYRLIGYENRALNNEDFDDDTKDAGELGAGHRVVALYELVRSEQVAVLPEKPLKYQERVLLDPAEGEWLTLSLRYKLPQEETSRLIESVVTDQLLKQPARNLNLAASIAEFGLRLRQDPLAQTRSFRLIAEQLQPLLADPLVAELQQLMLQADAAEAALVSQHVD